MKRQLLFIAVICLLPFCLFSQSGKKYILLEEFSTAQCGFCPDGDIVADTLIHHQPYVIWVTHHAGFGTDSLTTPESAVIANNFTVFAPGGVIDRLDIPIPVYTYWHYIAVSRQKWDSICRAHKSDVAYVDIKIKNSFDSSTRKVQTIVNATFTQVPATGDLRLNVFLVEDSVVGFGHGFDQKSYFNTQYGHPLYGKGDTIIGYAHHRVVRKIPTGNWGLTGIIPATPVVGKTYTDTLNIPVSARWNESKMDVVAFVSYYNADTVKRKVLNSNHAALLNGTTGISFPENQLSKNTAIYPNPASEEFILSGELQFPGKLVISSMDGKEIKSFTLSGRGNEIFSASGFDNGIYLYQVVSGSQVKSSGKLVVIH